MGSEKHIIQELNAYFNSESILKDMVSCEAIDDRIAELRNEYGIFYHPHIQQYEYDPEYVSIKRTDLANLSRRDNELSDIKAMFYADFYIPLASGDKDVSYTEFLKNEIKKRVSNSIEEENKEKERIESIRESVCKLLGISDCTGWQKIQTIIEEMTGK